MTDTGQFEAFVRRYQDMVFGTAIRLLGNASDAEDTAQTVFMKAFERFEAIGSSPTAAGWLKTVTTNVCLNHLSRHRTRWRLFSELGRNERRDADPSYEDEVAEEASQGRDMEKAEEHARLERALQGLPDHQRVPLVLFHFESKTYGEIATALGVSLGKLKTDIHRGREALRRELDHSE